MQPARDRRPAACATTPSSSAAATTVSSAPAISPRPVCRWACSSVAASSAAPRSPRNSIPDFAIRPRATRSACCIRRSSATCGSREHGLTIVERPLSNFLPLPDGDYLKVGGGLRGDAGRGRAILAQGRRRAAGVLRDARRCRRRAARAAAAKRRPTSVAASHELLERLEGRRRAEARCRCAAQRDLLDLFTKSAGDVLDRWFESAPIKAAFGFDADRRQFRESVHARLRVRAAAPRLRRGQRQARPVGPRARRHGRDHAGDGGAKRARAASRSSPMRAVARVIVERRPRVRRRARRRRARSPRAASSPTSIRSCCSCS